MYVVAKPARPRSGSCALWLSQRDSLHNRMRIRGSYFGITKTMQIPSQNNGVTMVEAGYSFLDDIY